MGMFDYVICPEAQCRCGADMGELQSKSGDCTLSDLSLQELYNEAKDNGDLPATFYGTCFNGHWQVFAVVPLRELTFKRVA